MKMKCAAFISLLAAIMLLFTACARQTILDANAGADIDDVSDRTEQSLPDNTLEAEGAISPKPAQPQALILTIDGTPFEVQWESNQTVDEFAAYSQNEIIVVNASRYGGFEQVGSLPQSFSRNDEQTTTEPGDIVLHSGDQLVVFFGSNSWSYTRLGHIEGLSTDELTALLDKDTTVIEIKND